MGILVGKVEWHNAESNCWIVLTTTTEFVKRRAYVGGGSVNETINTRAMIPILVISVNALILQASSHESLMHLLDVYEWFPKKGFRHATMSTFKDK